MKYWIGMLLLGILFFVISPFCESFTLGKTTFYLGSIVQHISATFFVFAFLTATYKLLGEEPVVKHLNQLIEMQKISKKLFELGIQDINIHRRQFDPKVIENELFKSETLFFLANNFDAIKYSGTKNYFKNYLENNGSSSIKLLIHKNSESLNKIFMFKNTLPNTQKERFIIKTTDKIKNGIYGSNDKLYATLYFYNLAGDECPTILCKKSVTSKQSFYNVFKNEFDDIWEKGSVDV